jgi:hypothetical protein
MSYFIKVDASRLKQCPNLKNEKMGALKYTIGSVKFRKIVIFGFLEMK